MPPKPRIRIPIHVAVYTIAFIPGAAYAYYWYKNAPTDEEFEAELRKNYSHNIENSKDKHEQMSTFLQGMQDPNSDQHKQMDRILLGGRGQQKRLHAVDEDVYGTDEGAKLQREARERAASSDNKGKRKRKKKKKKKGVDNDAENDGNAESETNDASKTGQGGGSGGRVVTQSVAAVAVVGALAAGASFLLGGKRSQ